MIESPCFTEATSNGPVPFAESDRSFFAAFSSTRPARPVRFQSRSESGFASWSTTVSDDGDVIDETFASCAEST